MVRGGGGDRRMRKTWDGMATDTGQWLDREVERERNQGCASGPEPSCLAGQRNNALHKSREEEGSGSGEK